MKIELTQAQLDKVVAVLEREATRGDDWYLRNRGREVITDMFRVIRHVQVFGGFKNSEIIRMMVSVWRSQGDVVLVNHLLYMMKSLYKIEKSR